MSSSNIQQNFFKNYYPREGVYSFTRELSKIVISFSDFFSLKNKKPECEKDEEFIEILKKEVC
jgi:hypothetical protein